jgi:hypothetical protein
MDTSPSIRFYVIAILIVASCVSVIVAYLRVIPCAWCHGPWAIWPRAVGDLCRSCSRVFDGHVHRVGRKRSLMRRIWRRAA